MCDTGDDAEVAAGGAAAAVDAGATLQNLLQQGAAGSAGLDPNLAAQLVTALKDQVQRATSTLTAQVATLEATSLRDREASDHKRRRTEALRVVEERKWETSRANGAVREATKTQFDSGFVLKELQSISTLLAPPPSGSAPDQGDQQPPGRSCCWRTSRNRTSPKSFAWSPRVLQSSRCRVPPRGLPLRPSSRPSRGDHVGALSSFSIWTAWLPSTNGWTAPSSKLL